MAERDGKDYISPTEVSSGWFEDLSGSYNFPCQASLSLQLSKFDSLYNALKLIRRTCYC